MKPSEILLKAALLIRERGHAKGVMRNDAGGMCISGAVYCAATGNPWSARFNAPDNNIRASGLFIARVIGTSTELGNGQQILDWNNDRRRTAGQVFQALFAASRLATSEGQ